MGQANTFCLIRHSPVCLMTLSHGKWRTKSGYILLELETVNFPFQIADHNVWRAGKAWLISRAITSDLPRRWILRIVLWSPAHAFTHQEEMIQQDIISTFHDQHIMGQRYPTFFTILFPTPDSCSRFFIWFRCIDRPLLWITWLYDPLKEVTHQQRSPDDSITILRKGNDWVSPKLLALSRAVAIGEEPVPLLWYHCRMRLSFHLMTRRSQDLRRNTGFTRRCILPLRSLLCYVDCMGDILSNFFLRGLLLLR